MCGAESFSFAAHHVDQIVIALLCGGIFMKAADVWERNISF